MKSTLLIVVLCLGSMLSRLSAADDVSVLPGRAKAVLLQALREEKGLVQVHAADALVAAKELGPVRAVYEAQLPIDPTSPFRVGAWRSLAGAARNPAERAQWIGKIEREFLDPNGTLRVGAIESLCKLGHVVSGEVREAARVMAANGP